MTLESQRGFLHLSDLPIDAINGKLGHFFLMDRDNMALSVIGGLEGFCIRLHLYLDRQASRPVTVSI